MNSTQRVIKYFAMAFAAFLAVSIVSAIITVCFSVLHVTGIIESNIDKNRKANFSETFEDVKNLNIKVDAGNFKIVNGDEFKLEAKNVSESFKPEMDGTTLKIRDARRDFFDFIFREETSEIILTIPEGSEFSEASIEFGAGNAELTDIKAETLMIKSGAGKLACNRLEAKSAKIESGVGEFTFSESLLNDVTLKCGVGEFNYNGSMTGDCKVNCGVGKVQINLTDNKDDFEIRVNTGIGKLEVDGDKMDNGETINSGAENKIYINGGIGKTEINFNAQF